MSIENIDNVIRYGLEHGFLRIVPAINIDALLAAGILSKNLYEHGVRAPVNLDPKVILDSEEPILLIDLPVIGKENIKFLSYNGETSISAYLTFYFDKTFGVSKWDKILSILSGVYRELDVGKEGFRGLERDFLDELAKTNIVGVDLGFRLWGWKNQSLLKAFYRTLIPFIPGYSGDPSNVDSLLRNVLNIKEIEHVKGEYLFSSGDKEQIKQLLQKLNDTIELLDAETKKKILFKLLGHVYQISVDEGLSADLFELLGAFNVFISLNRENPLYMVLASVDKSIVSQTLLFYYEIIDELCIDVSTVIKQYLINNSIPELNTSIERPELLIEILRSIEKLPSNKPLIIERDGGYITSLTDYLRVRNDPVKAYSLCEPLQICRVDEKGDLVKA